MLFSGVQGLDESCIDIIETGYGFGEIYASLAVGKVRWFEAIYSSSVQQVATQMTKQWLCLLANDGVVMLKETV